MARMTELSHKALHNTSRGKFGIGKFFELRNLARNTVGESNHIFDLQLSSLLNLYEHIDEKIDEFECGITKIITDINPNILSIPGVGAMSVAVIIFEFGDINRFSGPQAMLSFAGMEPEYSQAGTMKQKGRMVKRGSSHLRSTLR